MISVYNLFEGAGHFGVKFLQRLSDTSKSPLLFHATNPENVPNLIKHGVLTRRDLIKNNIDAIPDNTAYFTRPTTLHTIKKSKSAIEGNKSFDSPATSFKFLHGRENIKGKLDLYKTLTGKKEGLSDKMENLGIRKGLGSQNTDLYFSLNKPLTQYGNASAITTDQYVKNAAPGIKQTSVWHPDEVLYRMENKKRKFFEPYEMPNAKVKAVGYTPSPDQETRKMVRDLKEKFRKGEGPPPVPQNKKVLSDLIKKDLEGNSDVKHKFKWKKRYLKANYKDQNKYRENRLDRENPEQDTYIPDF